MPAHPVSLTTALLLTGCATFNAPHAQLERLRSGSVGSELAGVAVAQRDATGHFSAAAAGCAQFADDGHRCRAPLTDDTLLRVASISKLATTLGVMRLVESGKLALDRDVSDYLGFTLRNAVFADRAITLRQLLAHSSSLVDGEIYWAPHPQTLQQLLADQTHFDGARAPGSCFRYTNLNFGVIASIIERVSGERFDRFMQHAVFGRAHIEAGFNWSGLTAVAPQRVGGIWRRAAPDASPDAAANNTEAVNTAAQRNAPWQAQLDDFQGRAPTVGVRYHGAGSVDRSRLRPPPEDYVLGSNGTLFSPQGGMRISLRGLIALGEQWLPRRSQAGHAPPSPHLLTDASLDILLGVADPPELLPDCDHGVLPPSRHYGLGVEVLQFSVGGPRWVGHFGDAYGLKSALLVDRHAGVVRAYVINGSAQPIAPAAPPFVEMDRAEAALLSAWPLSRIDHSEPRPAR